MNEPLKKHLLSLVDESFDSFAGDFIEKCPVCNIGVHFAGKIMEYEDGILVESELNALCIMGLLMIVEDVMESAGL